MKFIQSVAWEDATKRRLASTRLKNFLALHFGNVFRLSQNLLFHPFILTNYFSDYLHIFKQCILDYNSLFIRIKTFFVQDAVECRNFAFLVLAMI